jgi:hypothetical protein
LTPLEVEFWRKASADLGIEIIAPFELVLPFGQNLTVSALVKDFGLPNGMIVNADYSLLRPHTKAIENAGYGYASGLGKEPNKYDRAQLIDVLKDWGWTGATERKPTWI